MKLTFFSRLPNYNSMVHLLIHLMIHRRKTVLFSFINCSSFSQNVSATDTTKQFDTILGETKHDLDVYMSAFPGNHYLFTVNSIHVVVEQASVQIDQELINNVSMEAGKHPNATYGIIIN
jgi:hypothetical protein